jgi:hypothetical protein
VLCSVLVAVDLRCCLCLSCERGPCRVQTCERVHVRPQAHCATPMFKTHVPSLKLCFQVHVSRVHENQAFCEKRPMCCRPSPSEPIATSSASQPRRLSTGQHGKTHDLDRCSPLSDLGYAVRTAGVARAKSDSLWTYTVHFSFAARTHHATCRACVVFESPHCKHVLCLRMTFDIDARDMKSHCAHSISLSCLHGAKMRYGCAAYRSWCIW